MTPQQALTAATATAAELLRIDPTGDLLLLDADPGADITVLRAPRVVLKGGAVAHERA
jgi:imidazolonepropionase-like amidohydrolase